MESMCTHMHANTQRKASRWEEKLIIEQGEDAPFLFHTFLRVCVSVNRYCMCTLCLPVFVRVYITVCGSPYSSFYATLFIKDTIHTRKGFNTPFPPPPVNSRIVAQGFEKGRPQERRMWDESDSYTQKHASMHTEKRSVRGKWSAAC